MAIAQPGQVLVDGRHLGTVRELQVRGSAQGVAGPCLAVRGALVSRLASPAGRLAPRPLPPFTYSPAPTAAVAACAVAGRPHTGCAAAARGAPRAGPAGLLPAQGEAAGGGAGAGPRAKRCVRSRVFARPTSTHGCTACRCCVPPPPPPPPLTHRAWTSRGWCTKPTPQSCAAGCLSRGARRPPTPSRAAAAAAAPGARQPG